jgi:hypothetical protein
MKRMISRPVELVLNFILMVLFVKSIQGYFQCRHSTDFFKCVNVRDINGSYKCIRSNVILRDDARLASARAVTRFGSATKGEGGGRQNLSRRLYTQQQERGDTPASPPSSVCSGSSRHDLRPLNHDVTLNYKTTHFLLLGLQAQAVIESSIKLHGKINPITGLDRPLGFKEVEAPKFLDNRHVKVVRLSTLCTGRLYSPGNISGTHFY